MKVILDVTALRASYEHHSRRTGIFRVVDELTKGLSRSLLQDLSLISLHYPTGSSKYLKKEEILNKIKYPTIKDSLINKIRAIDNNNIYINVFSD